MYKVILILFLNITAKAEYRVFQIEQYDQDKNLVRSFQSTLDPGQYLDYYHIPSNHTLVYSQTWMCRGRTDDFKPLCPNPKANINQPLPAQNPGRAPANF